MEGILKHQKVREDGFIEVTFHKKEDFDDYLYSQIQRDAQCLPCIKDNYHSDIVYFDTQDCTCLSTYFQQHIFEEQELLMFFILLFESLIALNRTKYFYYDISNIYLCKHKPYIRFLVIPINKDPWQYEESQIPNFLYECMKQVKLQQGWYVLGCLCVAWKQQLALPSVVQSLYDMKKRIYKRSLFDKFRKKEDQFELKGLPDHVRYPSIGMHTPNSKEVIEEDTYKTVILFAQDCYFECSSTKTQYEITEPIFCIGRHSTSHLCIQEPQVSIHHAQLEKETSILKDLGSSNGTFVNDKRIQECVLHHLDKVKFAGREFIYYEK